MGCTKKSMGSGNNCECNELKIDMGGKMAQKESAGGVIRPALNAA
jgi:hypothetical protein